jgi:hypothetical protein
MRLIDSIKKMKNKSKRIAKKSKMKKKRSKKTIEELTDIEFMNMQTVKGLQSYVKSKGLKGYSKLRKQELIQFILYKINIETGELL